jgi:hypothetical protein
VPFRPSPRSGLFFPLPLEVKKKQAGDGAEREKQ